MALAPANTIESFKKGIELGVDMVEFDVHITKDNEVVVIHERVVDFTTDGKGEVNELTLEEIKKLNVEGGGKIPTLQEVIDLVKGEVEINIEIKDEKALKKVIEIIEKNDLIEEVIISSFIDDLVQESRRLSPYIRTALLLMNPDENLMRAAFGMGCYAVHTYHANTDENIVAKAHEMGLVVNVWSVYESEDFKRMKEIKVDGIITDNPGVADGNA